MLQAAVAALAEAEGFNCSYDWNYRERNLSRTAKKAARISLTTDTLEMMTCELQVVFSYSLLRYIRPVL